MATALYAYHGAARESSGLRITVAKNPNSAYTPTCMVVYETTADKRAAYAKAASQSLGQVGIEGACVDHVPAHRGITHAEHQQNQTRGHESARHARAIA